MATEGAKKLAASIEEIFPIAEPWQRHKIHRICTGITCDYVDVELLRRESKSEGGLLCKELRKRVWPKLLGVNIYHIPDYTGPPLHKHKESGQVGLDVNRCGRRLPKEFTLERNTLLQEQLKRVILRLLSENDLCYYQGLHDVVLTFLLVLDEEDLTFALTNVLVKHHLRDFLDRNIEHTKCIVNYIRPLLSLVDPQVESFIAKLRTVTYQLPHTFFSSHDVDNAEDVCRITDFLLSSHPLMPVYLSVTLILRQRNKLLSDNDCEMSVVHSILSKLPEDAPYDELVLEASQLFTKYPPSAIARRGKLKLNASYMNKSHSTFQYSTRWQRPDQILVSLPHTTPTWTMLGSTYHFTSRVLLYSAPVVVGVVIYWWMKYRSANLQIQSSSAF